MAKKLIFNEKDMIELQNLLRVHNKTITTAESCTGGLIAHKITQISGSSDVFNGSIVSYSNEIKHNELNVKNETLETFGAVSHETVNEMLDGAINKFKADFAIAVSGIAGPLGGTKNKPVGTVVIGITYKNIDKIVSTYTFNGDRIDIQNKAANQSLDKILKFIKKTLDK